MSDDQPRLGKYEILRTLGRGAMGVVYEGIDRVIERRVAIKTVRTEDLDADEAAEHLRRFLIEARAAGKLNHPHIVSLYDHGEQDGTAYLVMELVVGRELQQWFDDGHRYPVGETVRLMGELLGALGYSHRQGVIHRDVKPANIFITEAGSLKLGDFGIARIESTQKTRAGLALGTPTHMAPEQIRGETADGRSDLYAAGVILFQLLTGTRPFTGTMLTMALQVLNQPAPLASSINPQVTAALDAVVSKALAKAADSRFQNAEEFWLALQQAARQDFDSIPPPVPATDGRSSAVDESGMHPARPAAITAIPSRPDAVATSGAAPAATARASNNIRMPTWLIAGGSLAALIAAAWWWRIGQPAPPATVLPAPAPPRDEASMPSAPAARAVPAPPIAVPAKAGMQPADSPSRPARRAAAAPPAPTTPVVPEASPAPPIPPPAVASRAPSPVPAPAPPPPAPRREAKTAAVREIAPPPPARASLPVRCSDILMKASLEPLTTEESRYLRKECQ